MTAAQHVLLPAPAHPRDPPGRAPVTAPTGSGASSAATAVEAEFTAEFAALHELAHRVAFRVLGDRAEAHDVAQESLTRAYVRWRAVRGHAQPWVVRVATNLALDVVRRRGRRDLWASVPDAGTPTDPWLAVRIDLQRALRRLPRRQREVVALRYLADRSEAETAALLGLRVGTVRQHTTRALARLRADSRAWTTTVEGAG